MSTQATADTTSSQSSGGTSAKVGLVSILLPVLLSTFIALGAVAGGVAWLLRSGKLNSTHGAPAPAAPPPVIVIAPPPTHVLALDPMVVNLADAGGRSYLRASISLRIRDEEKVEKKEEAPKDPKAVDGAAAALRDTTLSVLSEETSETLLAPDGREALKKKLDTEYKQRNTESRVTEIYITDFLVQRG